MQCVDVDGLCSSKSKYTHEETGRCVILKTLEITYGLFTKTVQMGRVGILLLCDSN